MPAANHKLKSAVEAFFADLRRIRQSGAATDERSTYAPLANLLNAAGATLKPKVRCLVEPSDQGAGHPDLYLYTEKQMKNGRPRKGQTPERGVVEVKAPDEDTKAQPVRDQVSRYWQRYRMVLVTNLREFELVGQDPSGEEVTLETFHLAESEEALDSPSHLVAAEKKTAPTSQCMLRKPFRAERKVEALLEGMSRCAPKSLGDSLGVAIIATARDLGAARNWVPRGVRPFNSGFVAHLPNPHGFLIAGASTLAV